MADFTNIKNRIDQDITENGQGDITGLILNAVLDLMLDAVGEILDNKVTVVEGKGLSKNDFTDLLKEKLDGLPTGTQLSEALSALQQGKVDKVSNKSLILNSLIEKLQAMPYITAYDYANHRVTLNDGNGHSQVYQLTPYVPIPDYYAGFANSSTANFQAMTKEQLMALVGNGTTVDSNPSYSGTWDEYILFVLKRTNVNITSATFTSIAGGGAQQLELVTMHDNITIDGTTYNVVGKRLPAFNAGQDIFTINFNKH